jgi:hypothetical protein
VDGGIREGGAEQEGVWDLRCQKWNVLFVNSYIRLKSSSHSL